MLFHLPTYGLDSVGVFLKCVGLNLNAGVGRKLVWALLGMFGGVRQSSGSVVVGYFTYRVFGPCCTRIVATILTECSDRVVHGLLIINNYSEQRAKVTWMMWQGQGLRSIWYWQGQIAIMSGALAHLRTFHFIPYMCFHCLHPPRAIHDDPNAN